jgi:uncharacterized protein YndB with AHSA1/START domain
MPPTEIAVLRSFRDPVLALWPYLSRPDLMERWLGQAEVELVPGGDFHASLWNGDVVRGQVLAVAPPNRLQLAWHAEGPDSDSRVAILLEHAGPGTRIRVAQDDPGNDIERAHGRAWWGAALEALHGATGGADAREWGDALPIVLRVPLARSASDVWPLLSTAAGLGKWLAGAPRFEAEPGGAFRFVSRFQGSEVVEEGRIEAIEPERLVALSWAWTGQGWEAPTRVELRLEPAASGSALLPDARRAAPRAGRVRVGPPRPAFGIRGPQLPGAARREEELRRGVAGRDAGSQAARRAGSRLLG